MIQRFSLNIRYFGTKPVRKWKTPIVIHQAQRPETPIPDITKLGLEIKPKELPNILIDRTAWSPPSSTSPPELPFYVERTDTSQLPVYTDFKAGRTKVITILRKCGGDVALLKSEMEKVVGKPVTVRPGKLIVDGNFSKRLKVWLASIGF